MSLSLCKNLQGYCCDVISICKKSVLPPGSNLGGLFRGTFWGCRGIPPCLKLVRAMLETWNLAQKDTRTYLVLENIPFTNKALSIFLMSAFFCKKSAFFFGQNSTFTQSNSVTAARDFLVLFSVSVRWKVTVNENVSFTDCAFGIRLPDCSKSAIILKNENEVTIYRMRSSPIFFDLTLFLLLNLVIGPSFMSISSLVLQLWQFTLIRGWPEIQKSEIPPSEFCRLSGDWDKLRIPILALMSLMKCY